jgi:hypothetical protein
MAMGKLYPVLFKIINMKKILYALCVLFLSNIAAGQTAKDSLLIKETSLNYIEGFYTNNFQRVVKAVHPELAKRIVVKDSLGFSMIKNMGASELLYNTKMFKRKPDQSNEPFKATITIFDISNDIATVKVTQNKMNFIDYLHLSKIENEWKIINVLWARTN